MLRSKEVQISRIPFFANVPKLSFILVEMMCEDYGTASCDGHGFIIYNRISYKTTSTIVLAKAVATTLRFLFKMKHLLNLLNYLNM